MAFELVFQYEAGTIELRIRPPVIPLGGVHLIWCWLNLVTQTEDTLEMNKEDTKQLIKYLESTL